MKTISSPAFARLKPKPRQRSMILSLLMMMLKEPLAAA